MSKMVEREYTQFFLPHQLHRFLETLLQLLNLTTASFKLGQAQQKIREGSECKKKKNLFGTLTGKQVI